MCLERVCMCLDFNICVLTHSLSVLTDKIGSENTSDEDNRTTVIGDQKPVKIRTSSPFMDQNDRPVSFSDSHKWAHSDNWDCIVCPDILVSRKELLQLLAEKLHTSRNQDGMKRVARCVHAIDRHVTVTTVSKINLHYWASGTYNCGDRQSSTWETWVEVEGHDLSSSGRRTSRLAFVVCAVHLKNIRSEMGTPLIPELHELEDTTNPKKIPDSVTFFLIRYATPHPSSTRRGPEHRPLCPGAFKNTHCLWKWASRPESHKRGCFRPRPWNRHRRYFGSTLEEQQKRMELDRRAWYDIIQVTNIKNYANVQQDPDPYFDEEVFLQSNLWS